MRHAPLFLITLKRSRAAETKLHKSGSVPISLCDLCVLCVSVVISGSSKLTTETQRTQSFYTEKIMSIQNQATRKLQVREN